jgi:O-antigen/teichoic acid export membrane protein
MPGHVMRWIPTLTPRRLRQLWYAPLLVLAMGTMMLRLLVMARVLDVPAFGEFSGGLLVSATFCMLGCLGLQSLLQREWPVNLVRRQELRPLVRAAQCNVVALACGAVGIAGAAVGLSIAGMPPTLIAAGLLHGVAQQFFLVSTVESRSRGDVLRFAAQNFARAAAALLLSVGIALWTGSALAVLLFDALVTMMMAMRYWIRALAHTRHRALAVVRLAVRRLRHVRWRSALTLMMIMAAGFILLNVDRWVASARFGVAEFAQYSFAWVVLSIAQSVQVVINASVYPLVARRFAERGRQVAYGVCLRAAVAILVLGALAAVPLAHLVQLAVVRWYPNYAGASALLPLFIAVAVLRTSDFWSTFLLITGMEAQLLRLNLAAAGLGLAIWSMIARPWGDAPATLQQVGWLAALLSVLAYAAVAGVSWRRRLA